jgi:hypothetical protein
MSEESNAVGRPTKYEPEYCEKLVEHMAKGLSFETFAAVIGCHRATMYEWVKFFPEFAEAKEVAFEECQLFWEQLGINNIVNISENFGEGAGSKSTSLNSQVWIFNMKNRFKWRDRQVDESEVVVNNNVGNVSDADLDAKIAEKMKKLNQQNES